MLGFLVVSERACLLPKHHRAAGASLEGTCGPRRTSVRRVRVLGEPLQCRLRNPGGFHLPPQVPGDEASIRRAIELLGNRTQRRLQASGRQALTSLVGAYPPTKEVAQQWKFRLERLAKENKTRAREAAEKESGAAQASLTRRQSRLQEIERNLTLPGTDELVQRAFSVLGRILARNSAPNAEEQAELQRLINVVPGGMQTTRRAIRLLRERSLERRRFERWPPFVPLSIESVREARIILRQIAIQRSAGAKAAERLRLLLAGGYPRSQRVARAWWKRLGLVEHLYRKKAHRAMRLETVERIRAERRARASARSQATQQSSGEDQAPT